MSCENQSIYNSVDWCQGAPVVGGIQKRLFYISKRDIVKWPKRPFVPTSAANVNAIVTYEGDFELAADAEWKGLTILPKSSPIKSATQGEVPNVTSLNSATLFHPGVDEDISAFVQQAQNDDLVFVLRQKNGKYRVIGANQWETTCTYEQESDGAQNGNVGTTITVEATDFGPSPFYVGTLKTADGDIDCSEVD